MKTDLKPGSEEAVLAGCTCPVLDNVRGKGWMLNPELFWISQDCPLHGRDTHEERDDE